LNYNSSINHFLKTSSPVSLPWEAKMVLHEVSTKDRGDRKCRQDINEDALYAACAARILCAKREKLTQIGVRSRSWMCKRMDESDRVGAQYCRKLLIVEKSLSQVAYLGGGGRQAGDIGNIVMASTGYCCGNEHWGDSCACGIFASADEMTEEKGSSWKPLI
jgi:hypothetical protein